MLKLFKWIGKLIIASLIAGAAIFLVLFFYYAPSPIQPPIAGESIFRHKPGSRFCLAREGFSCGRVDNNGYNNEFQRERNNTVTRTDVLIVGSSHAEAFQVPVDKNFTYLMCQALEDKGLSAYNIGASRNNYEFILSHLDDSLNYFHPRYVVIENSKSLDNICSILENIKASTTQETADKTDKAPEGSGKLLLYNLKSMTKAILRFVNEQKAPKDKDKTLPTDRDIDEFVKLQADIASKHNAKLIVLYHSQLDFQKDGSCSPRYVSEIAEKFGSLCPQHNVVYIDMRERFLQDYNEKKVVPYGFMNTLIGEGHLNQVGHQQIADVLTQTILELEAESKENEQ